MVHNVHNIMAYVYTYRPGAAILNIIINFIGVARAHDNYYFMTTMARRSTSTSIVLLS